MVVTHDRKERQPITAGLASLRVQRLIEHLCLVSSSVVTDSFRLRNSELPVATKHYAP